MKYKNDTGYPSVTQIINPYIDSEWWTDEARDRGNVVHAAISAYLKCLWSPVPKKHQGYVDAAKRYIDKFVDEILFIEERLADRELKLTGQPDLICRFKTGETVIVDWKTSINTEKWWMIQFEGYHRLYGDSNAQGAWVRLRPDGKYLGIIYTHTIEALNMLYGLLNSWHFFKGNK